MTKSPIAQYSLVFKWSHPRDDHREVANKLNWKPTGGWDAGEPRRTPTGLRLSGVYRNSYCYFQLAGFRGERVEDVVARVVAHLERRRGFLQATVRSGGMVRLKIATYATAPHGFELDSALVVRIARLALGLELWSCPFERPEPLAVPINRIPRD